MNLEYNAKLIIFNKPDNQLISGLIVFIYKFNISELISDITSTLKFILIFLI